VLSILGLLGAIPIVTTEPSKADVQVSTLPYRSSFLTPFSLNAS